MAASGRAMVSAARLRIADRHGASRATQGPVDHRRHVGRVAGRHHHQVRQRPQVGQIEHAVVRRSVGPDQPGPVHQQRDRQVLQGHFLEDLVVAPLHEGAVDVDDRAQPGLGQPGGERHRVRLADAHVEEPIGKLVADRFEHVALAHGGGDGHHLRVRPHLRRARRRGPTRCRAAGRQAFFTGTTEPFSRWKGAGAWKVVGSSAAGGKPCPFSVTTCSSTGPLHLPHHVQDISATGGCCGRPPVRCSGSRGPRRTCRPAGRP